MYIFYGNGIGYLRPYERGVQPVHRYWARCDKKGPVNLRRAP